MSWMVRSIVLLALLVLTAWNLTRSGKLATAEAAAERGDHVRATQAALEHLERRPWSTEARRLAALGLSQLDFADEAEPYYPNHETLRLDDLHVRAFGIVRANQRERAIAAYDEILERWPDDPLALQRIATVYLSMDRAGEGVPYAERLARLPDHEVVAWTLLGTLNDQRREPELAVAAFDRVLALDSGLQLMPLPRWQFWVHYCDNLLKVGRHDDARRYLSRAVAAENRNVVLLNLLGQTYYNLGNFEDAERIFRQVLAIDPDFYPSLTHLGRLHLALGRLDEAIEPLERAAEQRPDAYAPVYSLVLAHRRLGNLEEVAHYQRRLHRIQAESGIPVSGMGVLPDSEVE